MQEIRKLHKYIYMYVRKISKASQYRLSCFHSQNICGIISSIGINRTDYIRSGEFHLWVVSTTKTGSSPQLNLRRRTRERTFNHIRWPLDAKSLLPNFWHIEMPRIDSYYLVGIYFRFLT